jgi:hypothetical protein
MTEPTPEIDSNEPEVDRHLEQVIRELRIAENDWLPKHRESMAAHKEWKRLSLISDEARDRCLALRDEAREFLKEVGPR